MTYRWMRVTALLVMLAMIAVGCSSGGSGPRTYTPEELVTIGRTQLESVTTNLFINPTDARSSLGSAARNFKSALTLDKDNVDAKWGYAVAQTFLGFYDLLLVMPTGVDSALLNLMTQARSSGRVTGTALELPAALATTALQEPGSRSSQIQTLQMNIATQTLPTLDKAIPLYDDVETAVGQGAEVRLRMYQGGQVRTIIFGKADVQLVSAFGQLVQAMLNASVAFNLDMPSGKPVKPLPVDSNSNGMFDASEYLISRPFLEQLYNAGMANCLNSLHYAALKAQEGASLTGHTTGANALLDVTEPSARALIDKLAVYAGAVAQASLTEVETDKLFGDGVVRTVNLPKLADLTTARHLMPAFQKDDTNAIGVFPDPTFNGAITPGVPPGYFKIIYDDIAKAFTE